MEMHRNTIYCRRKEGVRCSEPSHARPGMYLTTSDQQIAQRWSEKGFQCDSDWVNVDFFCEDGNNEEQHKKGEIGLHVSLGCVC